LVFLLFPLFPYRHPFVFFSTKLSSTSASNLFFFKFIPALLFRFFPPGILLKRESKL
jgi:hypothetical protein